MPFPYLDILKRALHFTRNNSQLWVLGVFVSFVGSVHFLFLSVVFNRRGLVNFSVPDWAAKFWDYLQSPWSLSNLVALLGMLFIAALCKAALVWAAQRLALKQEAAFKSALRSGQLFAWRVFGLQIFLSGVLVLLIMILLLPVIYLIEAHEIGRTIALAILALTILIPSTIFLGLMFVYGPVLAVLYKISGRQVLMLSFQLVQTKMKESMILVALLIGIWLGFLVVLGFGIIAISAPVAFLSLVLAKFGLTWAIYLLIFSAGVIGLCASVVLSAALAVFNNFVWTLAVMEMVKTEKDPDTAKVLSPEAEPA